MERLFIPILLFISCSLLAECNPYLTKVNSQRVANYSMDVTLDNETKCLDGQTKLVWINHSPDTVFNMHFYMYQNAFKNTESTFMISSEGDVFGDDISKRSLDDWGWIEILSAKRGALELIENARYIQPDGNKSDESVLQIPLDQPLLGGDTLVLDLIWSEKIPKIFARSGHERADFYNMVHWFPQAGVWEEKSEGNWGWNCHQFHRRTEFFADFGVYDLKLTLAEELVVGSSGCILSEKNHGNGMKTLEMHAEDVIDFAWCAYPHFEVIEDQWEHVYMRLMIPPEHEHLSDRLIAAVKHSLKYMTANVGPFPYSSITILDPPLLGLKSGFMEYPTYITGGSFALFPKGIRTLESLIAHEFAHQYFMGIVATNEKEEPWMDEGFVTYHEDKIMESMYGTDGSLFNLVGYKVNNSSFSRHEYMSLENPSCGAIARTGWEIKEGFKGITYSKTATMFKTMEGMMGEDNFIAMMKSYFKQWQFKHPKGPNFINHVKDFLRDSEKPLALGDPDKFFDQIVYGTDVLDYSVSNIRSFKKVVGRGVYGSLKNKKKQEGIVKDDITSQVTIHRKGGVVLPVEILFRFDDGTEKRIIWSGEETSKIFNFTEKTKVVTVDIDPERKLYLDINLNNNSLTYEATRAPALKVASKVMYWVQNIIQSVSILI